MHSRVVLHYDGIYTQSFQMCVQFFVNEVGPGWSQLLGRTSDYAQSVVLQHLRSTDKVGVEQQRDSRNDARVVHTDGDKHFLTAVF